MIPLHAEEQLTQIKERDGAVSVRIMRIEAMSTGFAQPGQHVKSQIVRGSFGREPRLYAFSLVSGTVVGHSLAVRAV